MYLPLRWVFNMMSIVQFVWCGAAVHRGRPPPPSYDQSFLGIDRQNSLHLKETYNNRPIIGILAQELTENVMPLRHVAKTLTLANLGSRFSLYMSHPSLNDKQVRWERITQQDASSLLVPASNSITPDDAQDNIHQNAAQLQNQSATIVTEQSQPVIARVLNGNATYIASSYVKFVEAAGVRVVPILINQNQEYYEKLLKLVNGVLFPGGAVPIDNTSGFGRAGKIIYDLAVAMNAAGDHFPLWGTCLGFELLTGLAAEGKEIRTHCEAQNRADRLKMDKHYKKGRLFQHIPNHLLKALTTLPLTANFHHYCLTPKNFSSSGLSKVFRPLAYSFDADNLRYVAAAEAKHAPFFAVQFHPEKSPWEWVTAVGHNAIPHKAVAVEAALYFAQVLGHHARKNTHRYENTSDEISSLIYNYIPIYTGAKGSSLEQIYIF
ncbi:unnamed protein product [Meganyctiphanes norvegica]|uniref:folate gamma-glutamyl hydrolase n=1 Tax=Meganyctiphanes norvegica TaxID=48144 RepID=A0AAV2PNB1_MEGNR